MPWICAHKFTEFKLSWWLVPFQQLSLVPTQEVNLTLHKFDELDCLIRGIEYIEDNNMDRECYYFLNPRSEDLCEKVTFDFSDPYPFLASNTSWGTVLKLHDVTATV